MVKIRGSRKIYENHDIYQIQENWDIRKHLGNMGILQKQDIRKLRRGTRKSEILRNYGQTGHAEKSAQAISAQSAISHSPFVWGSPVCYFHSFALAVQFQMQMALHGFWVFVFLPDF